MSIVIASMLRAGSPATAPRRKGPTRSDGARFTLDGVDEAAPEAPAGGAFICPTALLQIQEAPEPEPAGGREAALRRGDDLLDRLDDLRLTLLTGAVPPSRLSALADALAARRQESRDPRLDAIIAEIELRAAVELAKFERAKRREPPQPAAPSADLHSISKV
ncbi:MAG: flagellar assembly protein FliX [Rhodospirillales bacterium]